MIKERETMKDEVYRMIEEGYPRSEICARLGISTADYWAIKKEWMARKKRESEERREFHRLRFSIHERCKRLLMRLTEEVKQYCEESTVEEIERILEELPSVRSKEELERYMDILKALRKEVEDAEFKAGVERRNRENRTFREELTKAGWRRLIYLDKFAEEGLSEEEKMKKARRIQKLYHLK